MVPQCTYSPIHYLLSIIIYSRTDELYKNKIAHRKFQSVRCPILHLMYNTGTLPKLYSQLYQSEFIILYLQMQSVTPFLTRR